MGQEGTFRDAGNVLCLDLGDGGTGVYICQRLFDLYIKICAFYYMQNIPQLKTICHYKQKKMYLVENWSIHLKL